MKIFFFVHNEIPWLVLMSYVAATLWIEDMSSVQHMLMLEIDTILTYVVTFNYFIFSSYYRCWHFIVLSGVHDCVSAS
jgi:hypothetical protein